MSMSSIVSVEKQIFPKCVDSRAWYQTPSKSACNFSTTEIQLYVQGVRKFQTKSRIRVPYFFNLISFFFNYIL